MVFCSMSKICKECGLDKPLSEFYTYRRSDRTTYYARCKPCEIERLNNRDSPDLRAERQRGRLIRNREAVAKLKNNPCTDCKMTYPSYVMDFDHVNEGDKVMNVAKLISQDYPLRVILEEIDKCELVCSNCHRIRTHTRKTGLESYDL
jgi:L-lysine 2,3-aminomutase